MKKLFPIVSVLFLLLSAAHTLAQPAFQAGGSLTLGFPQNEFADNVDNVGLGLTGQFLLCFPSSPLCIGASVNFLIYGSETREEPFSTTIPNVFVDVTTTNNIVMTHLLVRLQPPGGRIRPYIDGLFGFNYLWTSTRIEDQGDFEEIASSTNFDDITFGWGGGAGIFIRVFQRREAAEYFGGPDAVYIDAGLRYLKGGEAEYLKEGSIEQTGGEVVYDVNRSITDIMTYHVGATIAF